MASAVQLIFSERFQQQGNHLWWRSAPIGVPPLNECPRDHLSTVAWAKAQPSQFAAVIKTDDALHLAVDFARSIPLFYAHVDGMWTVSDDINLLIQRIPSATTDPDAVEVFRHCAVVLGHRTLIKGVFQVPAATVVTLPFNSDRPQSKLYRCFQYNHEYENRESEFETRVLDVLREQFRNLVEVADGRLLAIPLSGGIDSRLLAMLLHEIQGANILAFTYGQKDSHEVRVSESVARDLEIPWVFVESDPQAVRQTWRELGNAFLRECWAGASLPHYQDWYALHVLTQNGTLPPGSIILPGHTIVGNLHDSELLTDPNPVSVSLMTKTLLRHHGSVQGTPNVLAKIDYAHEAMRTFFTEINYTGDAEDRQSAIEWFNLRERQAKYINNSMRAYEYFGLDWALPMLNTAFVELWQQASRLASDENRLWYEQITDRLYRHFTGDTIGYFTSNVGKLPPRWKEAAVAFAESTGIATVLRRALSAKTQINHPMAFHALLDDDNASRIIIERTLRGSSLQGEFVERFLSNSWAPGEDILPTQHS